MKIIRIITPPFFIIQILVLLLYFIQSHNSEKKQTLEYSHNHILKTNNYIYPGQNMPMKQGLDSLLFEEETSFYLDYNESDFLFAPNTQSDTLQTGNRCIKQAKVEYISEQLSFTEIPKFSRKKFNNRLH